MNWTSLKLIQWTAGYFEKKGVPNPRLDAELLLAHVLKCPRIDLYLDHEKRVHEKDLEKYRGLVERRAKREPLQYIVGDTEFWGLKFKVTPDVLIPRPETEILVEECLKYVGAGSPRPGEGTSPLHILDIGTGSGCIAIALAKNLPQARIVATDLSREALAVARENAEGHQVADRIEFIASDIAPWKAFRASDRRFDLIVSNPPYVPTGQMSSLQPEVRDHEPWKALEAGPEGLDVIRRILEEGPVALRPGGTILMEIGDGQSGSLRENRLEFVKDYNGIERIAVFRKT